MGDAVKSVLHFMRLLDRFVEAIEKISISAERFTNLSFPSPKPELPLTLRPLNERFEKEPDMDIELFCMDLQARSDDVVKRTVTLEIDPNATLPESVPRVQTREVIGKGANNTGENQDPARNKSLDGAFEIPEDINGTITTIAYDNKGNPQETPTVQSVVGADLTAPIAEGEGTIRSLGERFEE